MYKLFNHVFTRMHNRTFLLSASLQQLIDRSNIVILRFPLIWHQLHVPQYMLRFVSSIWPTAWAPRLQVTNVFVLTGLPHLTYVRKELSKVSCFLKKRYHSFRITRLSTSCAYLKVALPQFQDLFRARPNNNCPHLSYLCVWKILRESASAAIRNLETILVMQIHHSLVH
jgi:hypothetical protein